MLADLNALVVGGTILDFRWRLEHFVTRWPP